jgi:uncharacterized protein YdhG (YjbR/CyaY superfamily)
MTESTATTIDEYIESFTGEVKERLETIRALVIQNAPDATESISYQMPAFKMGKPKKPLVYFAAFTNHIGFYPTPVGISAFAEELSGYVNGKGSVQFPHDQPLPTELITRIVRYRVQEVQSR